MKGNWIKCIFEGDTYVVNLDCISTFACAENGRLMFWLPDGKVQIIIHPKSNSEVYQQILEYVQKITEQSPDRPLRNELVQTAGDEVLNSDNYEAVNFDDMTSLKSKIEPPKN